VVIGYLRMHGPDHHHLYAGSYSDADLTWWADRIRDWDLAGKDVFVYFNNDGDANAVRNGQTLLALYVSGGLISTRSSGSWVCRLGVSPKCLIYLSQINPGRPER